MNDNEKNGEVTKVYLDKEIWTSIVQLAQEEDRTPGWLIRRALAAYIEERKRRDTGGGK